MEKQYIIYGTNIVCTYMTVPTPMKIGTQPRECPSVSQDDKPILRTIDCKISDSFSCRSPQMQWGGLATFLCGVVVGLIIAVAVVAVVGAVVASGGLAAGVIAGVAAVVIPTGKAVVAAALVIGGTTLIGSSVWKGYEASHLCDASLNAVWAIPQQNTIIEGYPAIHTQSFLPCVTGGVITAIIDDDVAKQAAKIISEGNRDIIDKECDNRFYQGIVSGLTGGANPISLGITAFFSLVSLRNYEGQKLNNNLEILEGGDENYSYDTGGAITQLGESIVMEESVSNISNEVQEQMGKGGNKQGRVASYNEAKANSQRANEINQRSQSRYNKLDNKATNRESKLHSKSSEKMQNRAKTARNKAQHAGNVANEAAQNAKFLKGKLWGTCAGIGLGVAGGFLNIWIDRKMRDKEADMEKDMLDDLKELIAEDDMKSKIISHG